MMPLLALPLPYPPPMLHLKRVKRRRACREVWRAGCSPHAKRGGAGGFPLPHRYIRPFADVP